MVTQPVLAKGDRSNLVYHCCTKWLGSCSGILESQNSTLKLSILFIIMFKWFEFQVLFSFEVIKQKNYEAWFSYNHLSQVHHKLVVCLLDEPRMF